jgi:hypothetical protein
MNTNGLFNRIYNIKLRNLESLEHNETAYEYEEVNIKVYILL